MKTSAIIVYGDLLNGHIFVGPFDSQDDAINYEEENKRSLQPGLTYIGDQPRFVELYVPDNYVPGMGLEYFFKALVARFPGFEDGETEINGSDLVDHMNAVYNNLKNIFAYDRKDNNA